MEIPRWNKYGQSECTSIIFVLTPQRNKHSLDAFADIFTKVYTGFKEIDIQHQSMTIHWREKNNAT